MLVVEPHQVYYEKQFEKRIASILSRRVLREGCPFLAEIFCDWRRSLTEELPGLVCVLHKRFRQNLRHRYVRRWSNPSVGVPRLAQPFLTG